MSKKYHKKGVNVVHALVFKSVQTHINYLALCEEYF